MHLILDFKAAVMSTVFTKVDHTIVPINMISSSSPISSVLSAVGRHIWVSLARTYHLEHSLIWLFFYFWDNWLNDVTVLKSSTRYLLNALIIVLKAYPFLTPASRKSLLLSLSALALSSWSIYYQTWMVFDWNKLWLDDWLLSWSLLLQPLTWKFLSSPV